LRFPQARSLVRPFWPGLAPAAAALFLLGGCDRAPQPAATTGGDPEALHRLVAAGRDVYLQHCAPCHRADGSGVAGAFPSLDGSPILWGPREKHIKVVLLGRPGTAMPAFGALLSDSEVAAVVTYERNAWRVRTFDRVTPSDVAAVRKRAPEVGSGN
jgi:cytochrome c oxidase subunit 2